MSISAQMSRRRRVWNRLFSALFLLGGVALLVWHVFAAGDAQRYDAAPICSTTATVDCVQVRQVTVADRTTESTRTGTQYDLTVTLDDGSSRSVAMEGAMAEAVWDAAPPGTPVQLFLWHGTVTQVEAPPSVRANTVQNPDDLSSFTLLFGLLSFSVGGAAAMVLALGARRRRATQTGRAVEPEPSAATPAVDAGSRLYRMEAPGRAAFIRVALGCAVLAGLVRAEGAGWIAAVLVGAGLAGMALTSLWWYSAYALELAAGTVTLRTRRGALTVPWRDASLRIRLGNPTLYLHTGAGSTRRVSVSSFMRYNRANSSLLRELEARVAHPAA